MELARHLGSPWLIGNILKHWGEIHLKYQQLDAAAAAFHEVLTLTSGSRQDPQLIVWAQYGLAKIAALRGDFMEARRLGTDTLAILEAMGHHQTKEIRAWLHSLPK